VSAALPECSVAAPAPVCGRGGRARRRRLVPSVVRRGAAVALRLALLAAVPAAPAVAQLRAFEFQLDNDQFAFTPADDERWYTSGEFLRFAFDAPPASFDARLAAAWCARLIACDAGSRTARIWSIGHLIFTPWLQAGTLAPQPFDRPYASALYGGFASIVHGPRTRQTLELRLGTVGPAALGDPIQNGIHTVLGQAQVEGWEWQVRSQPLIEVGWSRLSIGARPTPGVDWVTRTSLRLGTPVTEAGVGAVLRTGRPPTGPAWPGETTLPQAGAAGAWFLYAGAELRAVMRNQLIEGETQGYVSQVTREPWVGDLLFGGTLSLAADWQLDVGFALRSVEFATPVEPYALRPQRIGTLTLRWAPPR
jgi:lipid A 3-O-deacylase